MISCWTGSYIYLKFNSFSVVIDDFGHVLIFWWENLFLRWNQLGQNVEINFSSINFDSSWKLFGSELNIMKMHCSWFIGVHYTGIYFTE